MGLLLECLVEWRESFVSSLHDPMEIKGVKRKAWVFEVREPRCYTFLDAAWLTALKLYVHIFI